MPRPWTETAHFKAIIDKIETDLVERGFVKVPALSKLKVRQYYRMSTVPPGAINGSQATTYSITWQLQRGERVR